MSLPSHRKLVESLFAYDVVGFHTEDWLDSFRDYVTKELGGTLGENGAVTWNGRTIQAIRAPIGIETKEFEEAASGHDARFARERMYICLLYTSPSPRDS